MYMSDRKHSYVTGAIVELMKAGKIYTVVVDVFSCSVYANVFGLSQGWSMYLYHM